MGLNDPQWGKNNNGGPPDLEEMLRKLNQKLASAMNKNGGQRNDQPPSGGAKGPRLSGGAGLVAGVVGVLWLASGLYIVDPNERGVVLRFGENVSIANPGPNWHLPYPFETVEIVDLSQVRTVSVGYRGNEKDKMPQESLMLTQDENIIDIQFDVQYTLNDAADFLFANRFPEDNVKQVAEAVMREIVGKNKMDFVLYEGREQVASVATKRIQEILDRYQAGVVISKLTMRNAQPPDEVQAAFDDAVKAGQDKERQKNEGQAYANDVVPKASGMAGRLLLEAEGYKQRVIANAEGEAERFSKVLVEYQKSPQVTRERMYIDMMQEVMTNTSKVMVDQKSGNSLLYLPLDKLVEAASNKSTSPVVATAAEVVDAPAMPPTENLTSPVRGSLGREREVR